MEPSYAGHASHDWKMYAENGNEFRFDMLLSALPIAIKKHLPFFQLQRHAAVFTNAPAARTVLHMHNPITSPS